MKGNKWIWIVVILIIALGVLWYAGVFNSVTGTNQQAAVNTAGSNAGSAAATQGIAIKTDVATLDGQLAAINTSLSGATANKAQIAGIANNFKNAASVFARIGAELKPAIINTQTTGANVASLNAALADLSNQIANMTSQAGVAGKNASATTTTTASLTASLQQLKAAQGYAQAARSDLNTILKGLNIQ